MRIAVRGGHNPGVPGANGIVNEITEDRLYSKSVMKYLLELGYGVLDVTPPGNTATSGEDLTYGVNKANAWKADLFVSCHVNAGGGQGVEVLYHDGAAVSGQYAVKVDLAISSLGFRSRGAKADIRGLYEMHATNMPAIIIEPFFLDSQSDVDIYRKIGFDQLGKTIVEAIAGKQVPDQEPNLIEAAPVYKTVTASVLNVRSGASLNCPQIGKLAWGDKVRIGASSNGWTNIFYGAHGGYVSSQYLK